MFKGFFLVFVGGGLGSALRFYIGKWLNNSANGFPFATFTVNVLGSFLMGIVLASVLKNENFSQNHALLFATGFCGGFTTFSAFAYESFTLLKMGNFGVLFLYVFTSLLFGIVAIYAGVCLTK